MREECVETCTVCGFCISSSWLTFYSSTLHKLTKSFRNDFYFATSSFYPHIFLLRFLTKTVEKEPNVHRIITRYHEVSRSRL